MANKRVPVNPKSAIRIKELCSTHDIKQKKLAEKTNISQNTITKIVRGKSGISDSIAQLISNAFPDFSAAYLKGETDYKSQSAKFLSMIDIAKNEGDLLFTGLWAFAQLNGYTVKPPDFETHDAEKLIEAIYAGYQIEKDEKTISLSLEEMNQFENLLCDMAEGAFRYLFKCKEVK